MKIKYFKVTVILSIIGVVIFPLIISTQLLFSHLKSNIENKNYKYMDKLRDEKINQIKIHLNQIIYDFQNIIRINSSQELPPDIKTSNIINSKPFISQVVNYNYNFKPLSNLMKSGYKAIDEIPDNIRITLQNNFYFSSFYYKDQINKENYPILVLFTKDNINNEYYSITLEYNFFDNFIKEYDNYIIELFNSKFQVISSSLKNVDSRRVYNNRITERMSQGFTENALNNDKYYSYGHIELNDDELFIAVSIKESFVKNEFKSISLTLIILYIIFLILSVTAGIFLTKYYYTLKEKEIQNEVFSDRYSFFFRFKKNLESIDKNFQSVDSLNKSLNYLKNDLEILMNNIPNGVEGEK